MSEIDFNMPPIPEDWECYFGYNSSNAPTYSLGSNNSELQNIVRIWYRKVLARRQEGKQWTVKDPSWIRAFPPGVYWAQVDDLGYPTFVPVADFVKTWKTGVLS